MDIYNRYTVLNEEAVHYINYVLILGLLITASFFSKTDDLFDMSSIIPLFLASLVISVILTEIVANKVSFIDDQEKDKNRWKFKYLYFICCSVLSFLLSISVYVLIQCNFVWIYWIPVIVFAFNIAFIPNLNYPLFEDCLPQFL